MIEDHFVGCDRVGFGHDAAERAGSIRATSVWSGRLTGPCGANWFLSGKCGAGRRGCPPRLWAGPWRSLCLADGLKADKLGAYGIWGGLDPDERGRLGVGS